MYTIKTAVLVTMILLVSAHDETNTQDKRQEAAQCSKGSGHPTPYAVQMEPIVQYSQRDPLYNPITVAKRGDQSHHDDPTFFDHASSEAEPIIEIIIKESNESLPSAAQQLPMLRQKPVKDPIQVFYVKYEKKKGPSDTKPSIVYEAPIPALNPVEKHDEIKPQGLVTHYQEKPLLYATDSSATEESTTLRAIIHPESEVYHSGSSGIHVTFNTERIPPRNHSKRNDIATFPTHSTQLQINSATPSPAPRTPKRQHGPYHNIQPPRPRVQLASIRENTVHSFFRHQQLPLNFPNLNQQFPSGLDSSIKTSWPQQRSFTQALPEIQHKEPFQTFAAPHTMDVNRPQHLGFSKVLSVSHQSVYLQNQPTSSTPADDFHANIHHRHLYQSIQEPKNIAYTATDLEKQQDYQNQQSDQDLKYLEQERLHKQQQQQQRERQQQKKNQRYLEQRQVLERGIQQERHIKQQEWRQEQEKKSSPEQLFHRSEYGDLPLTLNTHNNQRFPQLDQQQGLGGEILKAIPKLENHYGIRQDPRNPIPFSQKIQLQSIQYPSIEYNRFKQQSVSSLFDVQKQHSSRNTTTDIASGPMRQQQAQLLHQLYQLPQHNRAAEYQTHQDDQKQGSPTPQQRTIFISPQQSALIQSSFYDSNERKLSLPRTDNSNDFESSLPARTISASLSSTSPVISTTTTRALTTSEASVTTTPANEAKIRKNIASLPDEVPDDVRKQLLSSGILGNADIQILDYDQVGGIPIENLPQEALANFYGTGDAMASAASEPILAIATTPKSSGKFSLMQQLQNATSTEFEHSLLRPEAVEMKIVHFDPNTAQGRVITSQHIHEMSPHLKAISIGPRTSAQYNRYLPLKVGGASFPIPDAPELQGRKISSVVVLAPVYHTDFHKDEPKGNEDSRKSRMLVEPRRVKFLASDLLNQLVTYPNAENYEKWLKAERQAKPENQSVVLLVTKLLDGPYGDKEIFMYDISSKSIKKLGGSLSAAVINAAEDNADGSSPY